MCPAREADQRPVSYAEVKNGVELYLHSPTRLHGMHRDSFLYGALQDPSIKPALLLSVFRSKVRAVEYLSFFDPTDRLLLL